MAVMSPETRLRVSELLKERGMSASELMRRSGLSWTTIQPIAAGEPRNVGLDTLEKIARVLGVKVSDLLDESGSG